MATTEVKIITLKQLGLYDGLVKKYVNDADAKSIKSVKIEGRTLKFYKVEEPIEEGTLPAYSIEIPETDLTTVTNAIEAVKRIADKLDGEDTVEDSVKAQIKALKTELEGQITASEYNDTDIKARVSTVEGAIDTLNGTGDGSVKKQIDDAFNEFASNVTDDGVVNTYKELIDYCATHSAEAAEMAGEISKNAEAIKTLETYVGKLPEGTDAKTVIDYINAKVGAVDFSKTIATAKQEAINDSKAYADGLAVNYATVAQGVKADTALQEADVETLRADVAANKASLGADGATTKAIADAKKAGTDAASAVTALSEGQVATNKSNIEALTERVGSIESTTYVEATDEEINALFAN